MTERVDLSSDGAIRPPFAKAANRRQSSWLEMMLVLWCRSQLRRAGAQRREDDRVFSPRRPIAFGIPAIGR
ncbi:hypothetical protein [Neorhizobium vignae]|uniref:hypothetical protein n=1 Tax=Neorhizobium vignae TaxID=690585 RepID=UPI0012681406|nr:hypothetical protein [Neorhizobium vignae]